MNINDAIEIAKKRERHDCNGTNSDCYLIEDYALLYGSIPLHHIERKIELINQYVDNGFNIARILEYKINDEEEPSIYPKARYQKGWVLQERAKGHVLHNLSTLLELDSEEKIDEVHEEYCNRFKKYTEEITEYANAPQEQINKFVESYKILWQSELMLDPSKPTNFMYDKEAGFTFIDISLQVPPQLNEEWLMNNLNSVLFGKIGSIWLHEKNVRYSETEIVSELPIEYQPKLNTNINILLEKVIIAAKKANISDETIKKSIEMLDHNIKLDSFAKKGLTKQEFEQLFLYHLNTIKQKNKEHEIKDYAPLSFSF